MCDGSGYKTLRCPCCGRCSLNICGYTLDFNDDEFICSACGAFLLQRDIPVLDEKISNSSPLPPSLADYKHWAEFMKSYEEYKDDPEEYQKEEFEDEDLSYEAWERRQEEF